jgi:alpha-tubulin suppressor-like RCC1 family protein
MNKGPIDWPYPNGNNGYFNTYGTLKWISRSGRVYHHGPGNNSHGLDYSNGDVTISHAQEICFNHHDWWMSRDNGGPGRMVTPDGQPPRCIQIENGWSWAYFLFNNGEVWGVGENGSGAVGAGDFTSIYLPRRVFGLNDIKIVKISAGWGHRNANRHVLALDEYGYVWSWGRNDSGQLGHGHTQDLSKPERIPRSYFGGERVIDILSMGWDSGYSYARTSSNNLYAWGYNGASQLGDTTTTNRYRPTKMLNWDPVANNGILKWQAANYTTNAAFMILDGNRYLWVVGNDSFGNLAQSGAASRTQLTKTTAAPGGSIQDFWALYSSDDLGNKLTFIRHTNGSTYVCGLGSNGYYVTGTGTSTSSITTPTLIPTAANITNLREVMLEGAYTPSQIRGIHFLLDNGRVLSQGYNGYGLIGNPEKGTTDNPTDETGSTSYPVTTYIPAGAKVRQLASGGSTQSNLQIIHGMFYMLDSGQIVGHGKNRNDSPSRNSQYQSFVTWSQNPGEASSMVQPVSLTYAR